MKKGSKHSAKSIEKLKVSLANCVKSPKRTPYIYLKSKTVICIECGASVTAITNPPKRCPGCSRKRINTKAQVRKKSNPEKLREQNAKYAAKVVSTPEGRDKVNRFAREYYARNKEKCQNATRQWRLDNPELDKISKRKSERAHPETKRITEGRRRARKYGAGGSHTKAQFHALCEAYNWECIYCGKSLTIRTASEDHKTPLSRGGNDYIDNIAPCCVRCNSSKWTKTYDEYIQILARGAA